MVDIEIDGKTLQVAPGSMIIEVADKAGIPIPRFCYHKKLSIAANCRMCLVEVEKAPKPLPACATPVTAGMKIFTTSPKAKDAQRAVMEFLLINHPLDCPICDQGGECELQDISLVYGKDISRFSEGKRSVKDDDLGPLIATEMTRCIHCTRCVRFGQEVAGLRELGATGRGENMQITTYIKHSIESEMSGNIIDLCPVGALTSKPFRFTARAWELQQHESVAPHDCIGSNIYIHTLRQKVMRVVPREAEAINETWLSDRDRFSYQAINAEERLQKPMVKVAGQWQEVDWSTAFAAVVAGLSKIQEQYGARQIAALASPSSTLEEFYLLQKLMRGLGSDNIDHRLHLSDFADQECVPLYPRLGIKIEELEAQDVILLIGSNVQREQPIAGHRIRKATLRGTQVLSVNLSEYAFNFAQNECIVTTPNKFISTLAGIVKALNISESGLSTGVIKFLENIQPSTAEQRIAEQLKSSKKNIVLLGALAQNHPQAATLRSFAQLIARLSGAQFGCLTEGANSAGAWLAGAIPHRGPMGIPVHKPGLPTSEALVSQLKAYILLNIEPELDCFDSMVAAAAMEKAEFIVALSLFKAESFLNYADVILPIGSFIETAGIFVNAEGRWQSINSATNPPGEARPAWKVLRVLANQLDVGGFDYISVEQIRDELQKMLVNAPTLDEKWYCPQEIKIMQHPLTRITEWPIYAVDSLVRSAKALQQSATNDAVAAYINVSLADRLKLQEGALITVVQGKGKAQLPVAISNRIPDDCVLIHAGRNETASLGPAFGAIEIYV